MYAPFTTEERKYMGEAVACQIEKERSARQNTTEIMEMTVCCFGVCGIISGVIAVCVFLIQS